MPTLLTRRLHHLLTPLHPLLAITTGTPHPAFPPTLLHYHLLTETDLDALARHYHQLTPCEWSLAYPAPLTPGKWKVGEGLGLEERVQAKRRRFGRFVGLRGCESPGVGGAVGEEEEVRRWVEREMRRRMERAEEEEEEEEVCRRKVGW